MIFQPDDVESAASVVAHAADSVNAEQMLSEDTLTKFDTQKQMAQVHIRQLSGQLISITDEILMTTQVSRDEMETAKGNFGSAKAYYDGLLGDLASHGLDMNIIADVKHRLETVEAATENLEADLNQAINVEALLKEKLTTARLNYEEAVNTAVDEARAALEEFTKNATVVCVTSDEVKSITEAIALQ